MIGHLGLNVTDLAAAKAYYDVLMPLVGFETFLDHPDEFAYRPAGGRPGTYLFFYPAARRPDGSGPPDAPGFSRHATGLQHVAFMVRTRDAVHEVLDAMVALGSPVQHAPRVFPEYPQPYYAAFWIDPHGFLLEAVCHR